MATFRCVIIRNNWCYIADFKDTADLVQHLLALYNQNIDSKGNALDCAQTMLNIAHCYMQANQENAVVSRHIFVLNLLYKGQ